MRPQLAGDVRPVERRQPSTTSLDHRRRWRESLLTRGLRRVVSGAATTLRGTATRRPAGTCLGRCRSAVSAGAAATQVEVERR